jgi:EAL domain-containing protein (putative c-di-GMP-specific phosphodiesterase class I)
LIKHTIDALRRRGVRVALDGLRHGAVSWSSLEGLDVDAIKVEADLLTTEPRPGHHDSAFRSVLELAEELGVDVVAKGVQTAEQRERLLSVGYLFGQGSLFAEPHCAPPASTPLLEANDWSLSFSESVHRYCSSSVVEQPITTTTGDTRAFPLRELTGDVEAKQVIA